MEKLCGEPGQVAPEPIYCGVTTSVALTGELPLLITEKGKMFPVPLATKPIDGVLLVQV